jgi:hybrid cluster-associated redox disulfide protein
MQKPDFDDPELPLSELFRHWPATVPSFIERKMLCPGCPAAPFHTIRDTCQEYGVQEDAFRALLRKRAGLTHQGWQ